MGKLPVIDTPVSSIELPVSKKRIAIRAYKVKEERAMIMAKEAGSPEDLELAIRKVLEACTEGKVDIDKLNYTDIVFIFLKVLGLSKGNTNEVVFRCENLLEDGSVCGQTINTVFNLADTKVETNPNDSAVVKFSDTIGVKMRYPNMEIVKKLEKFKKTEGFDYEWTLRTMAECIESVIDGDKVLTDFDSEDLYQWLDELVPDAVARLQSFFDTVPTLVLEVQVKCPKCGNTETVTWKGLEDFFMQGTSESQQ